MVDGWRDRYRFHDKAVPPEKGFGRLGQKFQFFYGLPVDASGELADGRTFAGVRDFKRLLLEEERQIARNLTRKLVLYATGEPVRFTDSAEIERVLDRAAPGGFGLRALIPRQVKKPRVGNRRAIISPWV